MTATMDCTLTKLSDHTGVEVRGVDLAQPMDAALRARLNQAFSAHSVLVVRDQLLSPQQVLAAVQLFGEVFPQQDKRFALPECPLIHYVSNQDSYPDGTRYIPGSGYHTDHSNAVGAAEGDGAARGEAAGPRRRHAVREHAPRV